MTEQQLNDFRIMLRKRVEFLFREANVQVDMKNYDKAYALKIRADECSLILCDFEGYIKNETDENTY